MKRLNQNVAVGVLRTLTALGGLMATVCFALFCESWNSCFAVALCGLTATTLFDEYLKRLSHAE